MSTRANVVISYRDQKIGAPSELWLYHHIDGNVQGIGEAVVRAVDSLGTYIGDGVRLLRLWDKLPPEFENVTDLSPDIEFLYRITYADNRVSVIVRHGGYVGEDAKRHYSREHDTPDNTVELYRAVFDDGPPEHVEEFRYEIREPESYVRTLMEDSQPAARAWRGRLRGPAA
jgi:hypothetical protein